MTLQKALSDAESAGDSARALFSAAVLYMVRLRFYSKQLLICNIVVNVQVHFSVVPCRFLRIWVPFLEENVKTLQKPFCKQSLSCV